MKLKSIEEEWQGYSDMIFRGEVSDTQREETKKAFFAGAWAIFAATEFMGTDDVTESQAFEYLEARRAECLEFKNKIHREWIAKQ